MKNSHSMHAALLAAALMSGGSLLAAAADTGSLIRQGEAEMQAGRLQEALAVLERAVAADPESSLAYTRLGGAQVLTQHHEAAVESFQRAISLDGTNAEAFIGMAIAHLHTSRLSLARAALEEAARIDPAKKADTDRLIEWIDRRASAAAEAH